MIEVVVQELAPLHNHMRDAIVLRNFLGRNDCRRHESCHRFRIPEVQSILFPSDRRTQSILVERFHQSPEASERRTPTRMLEIVARAINRSVLQVIAHILRAIGNDTMRHAAR